MGLRRSATVGVAVVTLAGVGVVTDIGEAGAAPKPVITGTGNLACQGGGKFKALTQGLGASFLGQGAAKIRLSCVGTTGHPAVAAPKGKASGIYQQTGHCAADGKWTLNIQWKAKGGRINSTSVTFTTSDPAPAGWTVPGSSGTGTAFGSWAGPASGSITGPAGTFTSNCTNGSGPKGFAKIVSSVGVTLFL
jgi:hypothetical protein